MATAVRKKENNQTFDPETMFVNSKGEIKRLSKYGIWRRKNPDGIFTVIDHKAIYK